jgi:hypothetical protein
MNVSHKAIHDISRLTQCHRIVGPHVWPLHRNWPPNWSTRKLSGTVNVLRCICVQLIAVPMQITSHNEYLAPISEPRFVSRPARDRGQADEPRAPRYQL